MEFQGSSKKMIATQAEMVEARVPIPYRDQCAHLLIPLNKCRQSEFYLPWKCEDERHSYEKCEYELVMERMLQMQKIREEQAKLKEGIHLIPKPANLQTIATDFQKIYRIHDKLFLGLSGLGTDAQTLYQRLVYQHKLYQLREERDMKPETFASLVSARLYEKR